MKRKKIVVGNWKMNKDYQSGMELVSETANMIHDECTSDVITVFATPFIHLNSVAHLVKSYPSIFVAAQNCHHEESGAYTGEISAEMIRSTGSDYVIIGHSERRTYFNENHTILAKKIDVALKYNLTPIFCVGETLDERKSGNYLTCIHTQIKESLFHLSDTLFAKIVLAYEPVWAIGTGMTATSEQAQEIHAYIRNQVATHYSQDIADQTPVLYGGSCNPQNAKSLFLQPDIDGGLIGGASLKSRDFAHIVTTFNSIS